MVGSGKASRYRVEKILGRGGMGQVVLAHDLELDRQVALKTILADRPSEEVWARFRREAELLVSVRHEALVELLDAQLEGDPPFLVFRYMEGGSLAQRLSSEGQPMPTGQVVEMGLRLAGALEALHRAGALHRDVKPGNVLLDGSGRAYLADLGLGRPAEHGFLTGTGAVLGTPGYLAPELLAGREYTPSSDVYALAITLIEAALGKALTLPLGSAGPGAERLAEVTSPGLRAALGRASSGRPELRTPTAREFGRELEKIGPGPEDQATRSGIRPRVGGGGKAVAVEPGRGLGEPGPGSSPPAIGAGSGDSRVGAGPGLWREVATGLLVASVLGVLGAGGAGYRAGRQAGIAGPGSGEGRYRLERDREGRLSLLGSGPSRLVPDPAEAGEPLVVEGPGERTRIEVAVESGGDLRISFWRQQGRRTSHEAFRPRGGRVRLETLAWDGSGAEAVFRVADAWGRVQTVRVEL